MGARLQCPEGKFAGVRLGISREAVIGRRGCDLDLDDPSISARHARIYFETASKSWMLEDLQSDNGTFLSGMRVKAPERLGTLDIINFAGVCDFVFHAAGEESAPASGIPAAGAPGARAPAAAPIPAPAGPGPAPSSAGEEGKTVYDPDFPRIPGRSADTK
jgi:hypothetical protein